MATDTELAVATIMLLLCGPAAVTWVCTHIASRVWFRAKSRFVASLEIHPEAEKD